MTIDNFKANLGLWVISGTILGIICWSMVNFPSDGRDLIGNLALGYCFAIPILFLEIFEAKHCGGEEK